LLVSSERFFCSGEVQHDGPKVFLGFRGVYIAAFEDEKLAAGRCDFSSKSW
jgi:hypothetical protein